MKGPHDHIPSVDNIRRKDVVRFNCGDRAVESPTFPHSDEDELQLGDFKLDKEILSLLRMHCKLYGTVFEHEKRLCEEEFVELFNRKSGNSTFGDSEVAKAVICSRLKTEIKARKWERIAKAAIIGGFICTALGACAAVLAL